MSVLPHTSQGQDPPEKPPSKWPLATLFAHSFFLCDMLLDHVDHRLIKIGAHHTMNTMGKPWASNTQVASSLHCVYARIHWNAKEGPVQGGYSRGHYVAIYQMSHVQTLPLWKLRAHFQMFTAGANRSQYLLKLQRPLIQTMNTYEPRMDHARLYYAHRDNDKV